MSRRRRTGRALELTTAATVVGLLIGFPPELAAATPLYRSSSATADTAEAVRVTTVRDPRLTESSGLVLSPTHPDLAWTVNDSGSGPLVYGVSTRTGATRAVLRLRGIEFRDTEALTAARTADGRGLLWVGDIGDNNQVRDSVVLRLVSEPQRVGSATVTPVSLRVRYPGGPADAETLLWTPDGRLLIVTKELLSAQVLQVPAAAVRAALDGVDTDRPVTASRLATVAQGIVTDGAALPDGRIVLRGYGDAVVYAPPRGGTMAALEQVPLPSQPQGETLAVEASGRSVLVGSEGRRQPLWRVRLPGATTPVTSSGRSTSTSRTTSSSAPAGAASGEPGQRGRDRRWLFGVGAAVLGALAVTGATRRSRRTR